MSAGDLGQHIMQNPVKLFPPGRLISLVVLMKILEERKCRML